MLMSHRYNRAKALAKQEWGRRISRIRWDREREERESNPPPLSDANRVYDFLRDRKGTIAQVIDIADIGSKVVTTWVLRYAAKGRVDQFDLYRNGEFVLTGGRKKCTQAMTPKHHPILRYD